MCKKEETLRGRTFTGCWACRFKKRRCDETKPRCSLCVKHDDRCCYDVRLIWLDENLYRRRGGVLASTSRRGSSTRRKISRQRFKHLTQYRSLSPPTSDGEEKEENLTQKVDPADSFTISVRRLRIYDNAISSVYGPPGDRHYGQKYVNNVLNGLLDRLEDNQESNDSCCVDKRRGPFGKFSMSCGVRSAQIPSPSNRHTVETPDCKKRKLLIDGLVENKIYALLWLNTHKNMILSRPEYCTWFLNYMKNTLPGAFGEFLEKIIDDANPFNISHWVQKIRSQWHNNPDWQAIAFTMLTVVHGYTCPELSQELEAWIQKQSFLQYSMFPLLNFILRNTTLLSVLYHCNQLLSNNQESLQEVSQAKLTHELQVLVTERLVSKWRDRILEQLCACQDTSQSCTQLKFWELQLKHNEQFYRDIYTS